MTGENNGRLFPKICEACLPDAPSATDRKTEQFLQNQLEWFLSTYLEFPQISRIFKLQDFATAVTGPNTVGALAEAGRHHSQIIFEYSGVTVTWWSHKISGLYIDDFILANRTEDLFAAPG